jgi:hypothetical protein
MLIILGRIAVLNKIIFLLILTFALPGWSQEQTMNEKKAVKSKRLMLNFEDELVRGSNEEPSIESIFARDEFNFKKMIKIRQNFIPEAQQATEVMHGR